MSYDYIHTCSKCGKQWEINKFSLIMRDKDSVECECGETLIKWNGAVMFTAEPVEEDK